MTNKIDLHTHSAASDGTLLPSELVRLAAAEGIGVIALTDHDTVDGAEEFKTECDKNEICGISGVEVSADYKCEMHILGLFVDYKNEELVSRLGRLRNSRADRNRRMLDKLVRCGFSVTERDIISQKDGGTLADTGRVHFANAMIAKGYVKDKAEAFEKYLGNGKCCYSDRVKYSPQECVKIIHNAGGIAVLAHPILITRSARELYTLLSELKALGMDGVECYHSEYDAEYSRLCLKYASELHLAVSGGSDFHGGNKPEVKIGTVNGGETIPLAVYENLLRYKASKRV